MELTRYAKRKARDKYAEAWARVESMLQELWPDAVSVRRELAFVNALSVVIVDFHKESDMWMENRALATVPITGPRKVGHRWQWPTVDPVKMVETVKALKTQLPAPAFSLNYTVVTVAAGITNQINRELFN